MRYNIIDWFDNSKKVVASAKTQEEAEKLKSELYEKDEKEEKYYVIRRVFDEEWEEFDFVIGNAGKAYTALMEREKILKLYEWAKTIKCERNECKNSAEDCEIIELNKSQFISEHLGRFCKPCLEEFRVKHGSDATQDEFKSLFREFKQSGKQKNALWTLDDFIKNRKSTPQFYD